MLGTGAIRLGEEGEAEGRMFDFFLNGKKSRYGTRHTAVP